MAEEEEEEEVLIEVEAVQAMYGDDCVVIDSFPPHLHVHIKPRTADVSSQQFVEAIIGIRAGPKYPNEPPCINLIESKGLDDQRQKQLISSIQDKACELSSCLMLVALCEEAVEKLSIMNHPDGNCPLCLYPLVPEDEPDETLPFMKLMSCFHCFHSECIMRWWNWLQKEKDSNASSSSITTVHFVEGRVNQNAIHELMGESLGNCPVCRKVFHTKDFEHVLSLVGVHCFELSSDRKEVNKELLQSDSESIRRQKFEALLKLQQENNGLIEPKKSLVVLPGMYLPQPVTVPAQMVNKETTVETQRDSRVSMETKTGDSSNKPSPRERRNLGRRMQVTQNARKQVRQWVRKEDGPSN
ncbi:E3 ubiquitin-protein ligase RNF25 [Ricinus communis]|uniref:RING finger protein, putative n=1 Tax=Ricinus communis TaxID=3988 RepID=B9RCZ1_RICCO|nr:E3 ubiquitin-protein ligase RNF25 [Ricinus communis]EEF50249.1 RING finger protein, putative [Ricinus communis]|eukprot:XP_002511580.1 E3 ubiquitin-protein ligase RNF25 [Ricinus communis]